MTDSDDISTAIDEALELLIERLGRRASIFICAGDPACADPQLSAWAVAFGDPETIERLVQEGYERLVTEARLKPALH